MPDNLHFTIIWERRDDKQLTVTEKFQSAENSILIIESLVSTFTDSAINSELSPDEKFGQFMAIKSIIDRFISCSLINISEIMEHLDSIIQK